jgi:hypothetical protein
LKRLGGYRGRAGPTTQKPTGEDGYHKREKAIGAGSTLGQVKGWIEQAKNCRGSVRLVLKKKSSGRQGRPLDFFASQPLDRMTFSGKNESKHFLVFIRHRATRHNHGMHADGAYP